MTNKLTPEDLYSLEEYSKIRDDYRSKVMAHKKNRRIELGDHVVLLFEDRLIMQYQVQEMLKAERIFEEEGIQEELDAYNPLIPDGDNWKATMLVQYPDVEERKQMLGRLIGIENTVWLQVEGCDKVYPIADEDLERDTEEKTSSVHFLRFQLSADMINALHGGAGIAAGVEHEDYSVTLPALPDNVAASLADDLDKIQ